MESAGYRGYIQPGVSALNGGVTRSELTTRAKKLAQVLRDRAESTDRLRRIPEESIRDLCDAGLIRLGNPERFGGFGLDLDTIYDVTMELARGCGSSAWVYANLVLHNWMIGLFPEQAQLDYFSASPDALCASAFNPRLGKAEAGVDGYDLTGHWDFASGVDACSWAMVGALVPNEGPVLFLVPRSDFKVKDTWFVSGLRGTGSNDVIVENAHIPRHRALSMASIAAGTTPGRELHDRLLYRLPMFPASAFGLATALLGMALGAVDEFEDRMRTRVAALSGARLNSMVGVQLRLAEAAAEVNSAWLLIRDDLAELISRAERRETLTLDDRVRFARDRVYVVKLATHAVDVLFASSGAHALYESSALQRFHRDVNAGNHQVTLVWDTFAEQYGRVRLGLEPSDATYL